MGPHGLTHTSREAMPDTHTSMENWEPRGRAHVQANVVAHTRPVQQDQIHGVKKEELTTSQYVFQGFLPCPCPQDWLAVVRVHPLD